MDDSGNYRGIGIGSLILKIFDWIVLMIHEKELENDENQFGFQAESSTSMCTWTAIDRGGTKLWLSNIQVDSSVIGIYKLDQKWFFGFKVHIDPPHCTWKFQFLALFWDFSAYPAKVPCLQ